jgi:hypothetical protein
MAFERLEMDAGRICDGLSWTGYTPPAALTDIMDNAVNAEAKRIVVNIVRENEVFGDSRKDNVKEYLIIDDGKGMSEDGIKNALKLGSSQADYTPHTLSKFGLGLKSASFSQGETLEIISSNGANSFCKYRVSLIEVRQRGEYGANRVPLSDKDQALIAEYLPDSHGTLVRITHIRKGNHPSIKSTLEEMQQRVGIIYYYFMKDGLSVEVDGHTTVPLDALFTAEAEENGNLDENEWNGREVRWIQTPIQVTLDPARNVQATIEVTQLPHPPSFTKDGQAARTNVNDKYRIEAGNYGFYVYRNRRLLSWAERFSGVGKPIIAFDNDYYSFRGRLLLTQDADDTINIDVKKSQIMLSDDAYKALDDLAAAYRRKSKRAWNFAAHAEEDRKKSDSAGTSNALVEQAQVSDELPGSPDTEEAILVVKQREQEIIDEQNKRFDAEAVRSQKTQQQVVVGQNASPSDKIFHVDRVEDHALYEPYYDAAKGYCVRINDTHRFAQTIYEDNRRNGNLQILFDLTLLYLATAEVHVEKNMAKYDRKIVEAILKEYRRVASELLATLCRNLGDALPHDEA